MINYPLALISIVIVGSQVTIGQQDVCNYYLWIVKDTVYWVCNDYTYIAAGCYLPFHNQGKGAFINKIHIPKDEIAFADYFSESKFDCSVFSVDPNAVDLVDNVSVFDDSCYKCPTKEGDEIEICLWSGAGTLAFEKHFCVALESTDIKNEDNTPSTKKANLIEQEDDDENNFVASEESCNLPADVQDVVFPPNGIWSSVGRYSSEGREAHVCIKISDLEAAASISYTKLEEKIGLYYLALAFSKMTQNDNTYLYEKVKFAVAPIYVLEKLKGCQKYPALELEVMQIFYHHGINLESCEDSYNNELGK